MFSRKEFSVHIRGTSFLLALAALLLTVQASIAAPYFGKEFVCRQPDGEEFTVYLWGDEFLAYGETEDGYTVTKNPKTGVWCYAKLKPDGSDLITTGVRVGRAKPAGLAKKLRLPKAAAKAKRDARRSALHRDERGRILLPEEKVATDEPLIQKAGGEDPVDGGDDPFIYRDPPNWQTVDKRVGLVLLAAFPDRPGDVTTPQSEVDDYCNDPSYTGNGNATSIYGYFDIQSNGKLQYNCIVTAYFIAASNRAWYTEDRGVSFGGQARELLYEGLQALADTGFDFTQCDGNGDGKLDGVNIFYAGSRVNAWADDFGLWPHSSSATWSPLTSKGLSTGSFKYQITDLGSGLKIGTFCHENGHMLCDFPDLYSYDGNAQNLGNYSLMSSSGSTHPVNVDPYLKIHSGWADVVELDSSSHERCAVQVDRNHFYKYKNPSNTNEYFLFEVRDNTGYEGPYGGAGSAIGSIGDGLCVYHALQTGSSTRSSIFTPSSTDGSVPAGESTLDFSTPFEVMLIEASPPSLNAYMTYWYENPSPGDTDAFKASGVSAISDSSTPALKFWDTDGRTVASSCDIHTISADGNTMTFIVGSGALSNPTEIGLTVTNIEAVISYGLDADSQTFGVFNKGTGTVSYTVSTNAAWLSVSSVSGAASTGVNLIDVSFSTSGQSVGSYSATITVNDPAATPTTAVIPVQLTVTTQPTMLLSTNSISETVFSGSTTQRLFTISNSGGGELGYSVSSTQTWLSLSSSSGTVVGEVDSIYVDLDATVLGVGTNYDTITITSADASNSPQTIPVEFIVLEGPSASISPTNLNLAASTNSIDSASITITNSGGSPLNFTITDDLPGAAAYTALDSDEAGGPAYSWIDISALGSSVALTDDAESSLFSIGFNFPFYGSDYTQFQIGANGVVSLDSGGVGATNYELPATQTPNQSLAIFWDDLNPGTGGEIRYHATAERLVVSWLGVPKYGTSDYLTFQVVLYLDGRIVYQYNTVSGTLNSCTVGIQDDNVSGPSVQKIHNATNYLKNSLAIEFAPPDPKWLTYSSGSGSVPQDDATSVWFYASSSNLTEGVYTALVSVAMNDINNPQIDIPVVFSVVNDGFMFDNTPYSVQEDAGTATITVLRNGSTAGAVSVDYATSNGTATAGSDYNATSGTLNWNNNEGGSKTFDITINNDPDHEPITETVFVTLSNPSGTGIVGANPVTLAITDNDNNAPVANAGPDKVVVLTGSVAPDPVAGALYEWDAADDTPGDSTWSSTTTNNYDWTFIGGNQTPVDVSDSRFDQLAKAYEFPACNDEVGNTSFQNLGSGSGSPATFEFVIDVDDVNGVIFETGATGDGIQFDYSNGDIRGYIKESYDTLVTYTLTAEDLGRFIHVVFVADQVNDVHQLYVDGDLKSFKAWTDALWAGSDGAGLGGWSGNSANGDTGDFNGQMALFRYYDDKAFTAEEVQTNFLALSTGLSGDAQLEGFASDADGDPLTNLWTVFDGPAEVSFDDDTATNAVATFTTAGTYTLHLATSDGRTQTNDECIINVTTNDPSGISPPSGLTAVAPSSSQVNLAWSDNSTNEAGFAMERSLTSGSGYSLLASLAADSINYSDSTVSAGVTYYYRVAATNGTNSSAYSSVASVSVPKIQASVFLSNMSQSFDGNAKTATVATVPAGLAVDVTYNASAALPTNVGSYAVVATINEASYEGTTNGTLVVVAQALPFMEDFEALTVADLNGQNAWEASNATVQTSVKINAKAAAINSENGFLTHRISGSNTVVWTDFQLRPLLSPEALTPADSDVACVFYFNTNANPVAYDGTNTTVLTGTTVDTGTFTRVTVRSDYIAKTWDLYIDDSLAAVNLGFYQTSRAKYESFTITGGSSSNPVILDDLLIRTNAISTTLHDIPYDWLGSFGISGDFNLAVTNDPDNDGFTTAEEFWCGTDPTNVNSHLAIDRIEPSTTNIVIYWSHSHVATIPPINIESTPSLTTGSWQHVESHAPVDGTNSWEGPSGDGLYYRLSVTNMP